MKTQTVIIGIIALLVVGGGSFYAGTRYQAMQRGNFAGGFGGQNGQVFRQRFGGQNAMAVRGQIISDDNGTVTVKMRDGSTKLVILSSSATIMKATTGTKDDLKTGENIMVFGTNNSDGSVTAQTVSISPMIQGGPMPSSTQ